MSPFEFVVALMSFVVAFAISEILAGFGRQFTHRDRVRWSALQLLASFLLLVSLVQALWGYWGYRAVVWTPLRFLVGFAPLLVLSIAAFFITPPVSAPGVVDARAHYFAMRPVLFPVLGIYIALNGVTEAVLTGFALHPGQVIRLAALLIFAALALSKNATAHGIGLTILFALQLLFTLLVTPTLS